MAKLNQATVLLEGAQGLLVLKDGTLTIMTFTQTIPLRSASRELRRAARRTIPRLRAVLAGVK